MALNLSNLFAREPVRIVEYTVLTAVVGMLVAKGAVSADASQYLLAALAALLGIPAVEVARNQVRPVGGK